MPPGSQRTLITPSTRDPRWTRWDPTGLPAKFHELREHQWDAAQGVLEAYQRGADCVWLDAPTGTGKTLVADLVRRELAVPTAYICHTIGLQRQFLEDFPYARLLMGRANYETSDGPPDATCADCTYNVVDGCMWCAERRSCPYEQARAGAAASKLSILNTAYWLHEQNWVGRVGRNRKLTVVDECDTLENELMGFVEFRVSDRQLGRLGVPVPKEGSHRTTIGRWFVDSLEPAVKGYLADLDGDTLDDIRERTRVERLLGNVRRICQQVDVDEGLTTWVRDVNDGPMTLKPVTVKDWGSQYVWRHCPQWLCMSATVISPDELASSTGVDKKWETVRVPMTFPVENRRIIVAPVADMSRKGRENGEWDVCISALVRVCDRHPGERVLVHTVSYDLARMASSRLGAELARPVLTYRSARDRDSVLARFRRTPGAVLVAPSMDRGVDLAQEDCRVVVVTKVPFPNLGDRQTSERLRLPDGDSWYAVQTIRTLVQMTGRGVRSADDWCVSYILDRQFTHNTLRKHKFLLPAWWREALDTSFPVRQLLKREGQ